MKITTTTAAAITGAIAVSMALFGTAVASATDDHSGKTYGETEAALSAAGLKTVVASRFGDLLPEDQCFVVSSDPMSRLIAGTGKKQKFAMTRDAVRLALDCNGEAESTSASHPATTTGDHVGKALTIVHRRH